MTQHYDVFIVGTGVAGTTLTEILSRSDLKIGIADQREYGGTCPLRGCLPKKVLYEAANAVDATWRMAGHGVLGTARLNWADLVKFKRTFTEPVPQTTKETFKQQGVDIFEGHAALTGTNELSVDGGKVTADKIVIAAGSKPRSLHLPGEQYLTTSEEFMELEEMPSRIVFVGGGFVSFEFAHIARRAGSKITVIESSERPFGMYDSDIVDKMLEASRDVGIEIVLNASVKKIAAQSERFQVFVGADRYDADLVVHGAGRVSALDGLDLQSAGVKTNERGIVINAYLQSVSNPHIYVAGDANAFGMQLTPVAVMDAKTVAKNLLTNNHATADYTVVPSTVFCIPPLGSVGIGEEEAKQQELDYEAKYADTSSWQASRRVGLKHTAAKIIISKASHRILGAHILGHNAEEVINIFALAMKHKIPAKELKSMMYSYPTGVYDIKYLL